MNNNITLKRGSLFQFVTYENTNKENGKIEHAFITSNFIIPIVCIRKECNISPHFFSDINQCSILWNSEIHEAVVFYSKMEPKRAYLKIRQSNEYSPRFWSDTKSITKVITD